jgi:hypothetical protein
MREWTFRLRDGSMKCVITNDDQAGYFDTARVTLTSHDGVVKGFNWADVMFYEVRHFEAPPEYK